MLENEAAWLQRHLAELPTDRLTPLLSIGSGTSETRSGRQPWIAERVFEPLERRGVEVIHHEHRAGPGVDLVGDLAEPSFLASLSAVGARSVLCCNVLEHLHEPATVAAALAGVVAPGSFLVASVPRAYPYHPDPIDTMLRPSPAALAELVPELELRSGEEVRCGTLVAYALSVRGKREMVRNAARFAWGRLRGRGGGSPTPTVPSAPVKAAGSGTAAFLVRQTVVTCAVFERPA